MGAAFESTRLKDTPLMRQAYELSYTAFEEKMARRFRDVPKPMMAEMLKTIGAGSIADIHGKATLRMAKILTESGCVSDEAIAGAMLYGAARENPGILRRIDSKAADYVEKFLEWDKQLEVSFNRVLDDLYKKVEHGAELPDVEQALRDVFAKCSLGNGNPSAEDNVLMKTWAVVGMELIQQRAGKIQDTTGLEAMVAYARAIARETGTAGATPVDALFKKTLDNAERIIASGEMSVLKGPQARFG